MNREFPRYKELFISNGSAQDQVILYARMNLVSSSGGPEDGKRLHSSLCGWSYRVLCTGLFRSNDEQYCLVFGLNISAHPAPRFRGLSQ